MRRFICACLLVATTALFLSQAWAIDLAGLPKNKWSPVFTGAPNIVPEHANIVWLQEQKALFVWAQWNYRTRAYNEAAHGTVHLISLDDSRVSAHKTTYSKDLITDPGAGVAVNYLWHPALKKIFTFHSGKNHRAKKYAHGWFLDPKSWVWQPLLGNPRMADKSATFNPSPSGSKGSSRPGLGALIYDPMNQEVLLIGGCGTWGRVGKKEETVGVGDWIYDEAGMPKRVRRILQSEKGKITEARKWYPANVGTWTLGGPSNTWTAIEQPLGQQPSGRLLNGAAYDAGAQKIVMFGGEAFNRTLNDTWIYDCKTKTWSEANPKVSPPPRAAHAMLYIPDQKVVLLAGGYGLGWNALKDTWVYKTEENTWTKLDMNLPASARYCSAAYVPDKQTVVLLQSMPHYGKNKKTVIQGLRLDMASAPKAAPPAAIDPKQAYHCTHFKKWVSPLPEEWGSEKNKGMEPQAGRKELAALPANTWVIRKQPMRVPARQWGSYAYDPRTHKGYAWGGGHYGYIGNDMSEYDVLRNRWKSMNDTVGYKVFWRHGSAGGIGGPSFQGWRLMGTHARKSYAVDEITGSVITTHGDVYSIKENRFVSNMGRCPGKYGVGDQVAFENAPQGVYGFHAKGGSGQLWLADVKTGKWKLVNKNGPKGHNEYATLCYDRKRNQLFYTITPRKGGTTYWKYDIAGKAWTQLKPANTSPGFRGCPTYVDPLDAILWVWGSSTGKRGAKVTPKMTLYKLAEDKFYSAPYKGAKFGGYSNLDNSSHYDPELKLVVRITHRSREGCVDVGIMRLDPDGLELTETK